MGNWTEETMRLAIKEVKKGNNSMRKIGEKYNIPASSIRDWISGKTSSKKKGPRTVLSQEEERNIVDWCLQTQQTSHGITFYMLRRKVADICQGRETPFKDGVPGKRWLEWFKKRHPSVKIEPAHALKGKRRPESEREILAGRKKKLPWSLPLTPPMMLPMIHPSSLPLSERDGFTIVARDPDDGKTEGDGFTIVAKDPDDGKTEVDGFTIVARDPDDGKTEGDGFAIVARDPDDGKTESDDFTIVVRDPDDGNTEGDHFAVVARDPGDGKTEVPTLKMLALPQIESAGDAGMMPVNS